MRKIKIITDSTCYLTKEYVENENITVVPLAYVFGDEICKEPFQGQFTEYYNKLSTTKLFPTTSQPSTGEFYNAFIKAFEDGYDEVIAILLSSKLSGTYNSAVLAKNMLENKSITIIDSLCAVASMRFLIEDAIEKIKEGKTSKEIEEHINTKKMNLQVYLTTESLEYLSRGGRLSTAQATVGNLLKIKPIIHLKDGELGLIEKVRGKNKAISTIINKVYQEVKKIGICHILNYDEAEKMKINLEEKFPHAIITIEEIGPVIGSHLGPGAIGICFY